jgi:acyl-CoA reductase-like NAD-dependent aldehyde dehydrogenase
MLTQAMTIDGSLVSSERTFDVINPATEDVFAQAPDCTAAQLDAAMGAAQAAFPAWGADPVGRRRAFGVAADVIEANADQLAELLTLEQGKPIGDARWEVVATAEIFRYHAGVEVRHTTLRDDETAFVQLARRPFGVVAVITPWNFPLALFAKKVAPTLAAGNTAVVKPSPYTPLATLAVGAALREAFPPGVLNVISGGDELGAAITRHPLPRKITFTGSTATGKRIAAASAPDLKRLTLELGGNDPAILLGDADITKVAEPIFRSAFVNNGQVCSAIKRVYVPRHLHDDLVEVFVALAASKKVGDGFEDGVDLGPLNNAPQLKRIIELVDDARAGGATVATGGARLERAGYFFEPTIVTDVTSGVRLVEEEQFGPVLPVVAYDDPEAVVSAVNAGMYGLDASVWGEDLDAIRALGPRLDAGTIWMNTHGQRGADQPFGGMKWSGIGVENGDLGLDDLTELQVLFEARG